MKSKIKLFHFTSFLHYNRIRAEGALTHGSVPLTHPAEVDSGMAMMAGIWLTTLRKPSLQYWSNATQWSTHNKGWMPRKTEVRFMFEVSPDDPYLVHWPMLAASFQVSPFWYNCLNTYSRYQVDDWYVYLNPLLISDALKIEVMTSRVPTVPPNIHVAFDNYRKSPACEEINVQTNERTEQARQAMAMLKKFGREK